MFANLRFSEVRARFCADLMLATVGLPLFYVCRFSGIAVVPESAAVFL